MLIEKLPEVQALPVEEKWRLIDEIWQDLAQQIEGAAPDTKVIAFLENRFTDYLADPSQAKPMDETFARLAERKRTWK